MVKSTDQFYSEECDNSSIICPNECSGDEIEQGMLQDHLEKCPFQVVECGFSHVGCQDVKILAVH